MGGVRVIERSDYLVDFLRERGFHEMRKARHEYLSYYGFDQEYVFVLVEGVVKASVTLREGTRFNISYIKGPSPVSLLRDEVSSLSLIHIFTMMSPICTSSGSTCVSDPSRSMFA